MAKIALLLPDIADGGAERILLSLAQRFWQKGYKIDLVLGNANGPYVSEVPAGIRIVNLKANRMLYSIVPLIKYLRRERPDVVLVTQGHAVICAIIAKLLSQINCRLVLREANTLSVDSIQNNSLKWRLIFLAAKYLYRYADGVIAVSQGVADDLIKHVSIDKKKVVKINNPLAIDTIIAKSQAITDLEWFEPGAPPVILGVGRLSRQKDFETLIKAFEIVRRKRVAKLLILGEGELRGELDKLIEELGLQGEVILLGFVDNPFTYMAKAAVFVLSSAWEGFPNVLVQAMACGTPVVATDCASGPAEILEAGKLGPLVPVGDYQSLAGAIDKMLIEPVSGAFLRNKCLEYNEPGIVSKYLEVLLPSTSNNLQRSALV